MSIVESTAGGTPRELAERFSRAMSNGAWQEAVALLGDDIELHEPPTVAYGKVFTGRAEVDPFLQRMADRVQVGAMTVEEVLVGGERAMVVFTTKVGGTDEEVLVAEEYTVRGRLIRRIRVFLFDPTPIALAGTKA